MIKPEVGMKLHPFMDIEERRSCKELMSPSWIIKNDQEKREERKERVGLSRMIKKREERKKNLFMEWENHYTSF